MGGLAAMTSFSRAGPSKMSGCGHSDSGDLGGKLRPVRYSQACSPVDCGMTGEDELQQLYDGLRPRRDHARFMEPFDASSWLGCSTTGRQNRKRVPSARCSQLISPPWESIIERQIDRPSPSPS